MQANWRGFGSRLFTVNIPALQVTSVLPTRNRRQYFMVGLDSGAVSITNVNSKEKTQPSVANFSPSTAMISNFRGDLSIVGLYDYQRYGPTIYNEVFCYATSASTVRVWEGWGGIPPTPIWPEGINPFCIESNYYGGSINPPKKAIQLLPENSDRFGFTIFNVGDFSKCTFRAGGPFGMAISSQDTPTDQNTFFEHTVGPIIHESIWLDYDSGLHSVFPSVVELVRAVH